MINAAWHERHPMPKNPSVELRIAWHVEHQKRCACRPIPAKLLEQIRPRHKTRTRGSATKSARASPNTTRQDLRALLAGGDRRSVAQSARARAAVEKAPERVSELARLATDPDWLVSMRALDLLEKLVHDHPDWVQPHRRIFIGPLADSDKWEIRLQIVRALPLLSWTARQRKRVAEILTRDIAHPQKFVRTWALDSLATFARKDRALMPLVLRGLEAFEGSESKALEARARQIRARLATA